MSDGLQLIVGLGNPGARYRYTRHNVGATFVEGLASRGGAAFSAQSRFFGETCRVEMAGCELTLLLPTTYMNESGRSVAAWVRYFKLPLEQILVVHDELDLPPGVARFKQGGGAGGHNGLTDIIQSLGGERSFNRLRIGIGHPGGPRSVVREEVLAYVLGRPSMADLALTNQAMETALEALPHAVRGDWQRAMTALHSAKADAAGEE